MTGICNGTVLALNLGEAASVAVQTNQEYASIIGIKPASRVTTVKPSGTTSCVVGTSSGIHAWHNDFYIRRMQCTKDDALYKYMAKYHPELVTDMTLLPNSAVIEIPQRAPKSAILRKSETALKMLKRVARWNKDWVIAGHQSGMNTNNVSATVSVKDNEWEKVGRWMWENRNTFNGLAVLPYDGGSYTQAPFEDIDEKEFNKRYRKLTELDLSKIKETDDNTTVAQELACAGGSCEIL